MSQAQDALPLEEMLDADFTNAIDALDARVASPVASKTAVYVEGSWEKLSYAEFGCRTDALSGGLAALGVAPGDRVAVVTENPLISVIAMYGIWKAGAVFAPINPQFTGDYLSYHLNDCGARVVIVSRPVAERIDDVRGSLIGQIDAFVDDDEQLADRSGRRFPLSSLTEGSSPRPDRTISFDQAASLVYTSGTTGPAKGVLQSHRWINQYTWQYRRWLDQDDVIHVDLPMYHVGAAFFNVVRALWVGASVALWKRFSVSDYWERIRETRATCALLLDVMIPWLLEQPESPDDHRNTLRLVHMQPLPTHHRQFAQRFGVDFITAAFGQTESGTAVCSLIDEFPDDDWGTPTDLRRGLSKTLMRSRAAEDGALIVPGRTVTGRGFMGRPSPYLEVQIHDERGRPCATGTTGELVVRPRLPAVLFSTYLGKPDYALHAFRDLWFHTGDAAHQDESGVFYYSGRLGDRLRIKGENVAAFDIEHKALFHPQIRTAAAVGVPSMQGEEDEIVLFVEIASGAGELDIGGLGNFLRNNLPKHMVPTLIREVEHMPVTQTNKIQKHKLRALLTESAAS